MAFLKKVLGFLFIALGLTIALGYEKKVETAILDAGYIGFTDFEHALIKNIQK